MDVTGDGVAEQFITTSLTSTKHVAEWTVFDVILAGALRAYEGAIRLPSDSIWVATEAKSISLVYLAAPDREREQAGEEKSYPLFRFTFAFPKIKEALSYFSELEAAKLYPSDSGLVPKLEAILLADYLMNPESKWTSVSEWNLDANDRFFRQEDKERAAQNTAFTPQVALSKIRAIQSSFQIGSEQAKNQQANQAFVKPQLKQRPEADPVTAVDELTFATRWSLIAVSILAAIGLLWWLIKRRL